MNSILETLVTVVGAMLVLALISQSAIEIAKTMFVVEGMTRKGAVRKLLTEAVVGVGLDEDDGERLYEAVCERLARLGQDGWRNLRLDVLRAGDLKRLVESIDVRDIPGLESCQDPEASRTAIAEFAQEWHGLAMSPVSDRYRRRMRVVNVVAAAVVVLALNVDALEVFERARTDPEFRAQVDSRADELATLAARVDSLSSALIRGDSSLAATELATTRARLDSAVTRVGEVAIQSGSLFDVSGPRPWQDSSRWPGVVLAILLVSLGAPFWHDLLGSVFGLKRSLEGGGAGGGANAPGGGGDPSDPADRAG